MFLSRTVRALRPCYRSLSSIAAVNIQQGCLDVHQAPLYGGAVGDGCLRDSTAAVARRLTQQTQCPLLPGTPFTLEGALTTNPFKRPRVILTPGPNPMVVYANAEWESLFGFNEEELKGQDGYRVLTGPGMEGSIKMKIRDALEANARLRVPVVQFCKDGTPNMMVLQLSPLLNKNGSISHMLACLKDVA